MNSAHHVDWWGTVRGRLGLVLPSWPNLMVYGTGGFAYAGVNTTYSYASIVDAAFGGPGTVSGIALGQAVYDNTKTGWTAGGGVEWSPMSFPAWSLKVEYLYTDLGSNVVSPVGLFGFPAGHFSASTNTNAYRWHTVRAGVNWHFNPFGGSAPVLAKY
jgi:outer membrane immunogenic protein